MTQPYMDTMIKERHHRQRCLRLHVQTEVYNRLGAAFGQGRVSRITYSFTLHTNNSTWSNEIIDLDVPCFRVRQHFPALE